MALKKTIAGHFKEIIFNVPAIDAEGEFLADEEGKQIFSTHIEKLWIPQFDVEMTPLEEQEVLASWAMGEVELSSPIPPTQKDEHEWLIEFGADYIKQKRKEHEEKVAQHMPLLIEARERHHKAATELEEWAKAEGKDHQSGIMNAHLKAHVNIRVVEINNEILERVSAIKKLKDKE